MEKSFKFKHIEKNLVNLFMLLYENKNIAKYIYYLVLRILLTTFQILNIQKYQQIILPIWHRDIKERLMCGRFIMKLIH